MEIYEGKRHHQESSKSSRSPSPEAAAGSHHEEEFRTITPTTPTSSRVGPPPSPPVPTNPIAPVPPQPSGPLSLRPCPICGRTFVPESLSKHVIICEKMAIKKRKTFDSSRQRREGTDMEQFLPKNFGLPENSPFLEKSPRPAPKPAVKPKPSVKAIIAKPSAELQRCPHCSRTFGLRAFERHVEWCADKAKILPATPAAQQPRVSDAKQRLDARTRYKAPPVRSRRTSTSRDKSSRSASVDSQREASPPRECGDYRHARRTSESVSSNDDHSPHVPVIRNTRQSAGGSVGDAHVKARQSRLARDLSNSSKQEPTHSSIQKPNTETDPRKIALAKFRKRAEVKKQEQLKKLEDIAKQYEERQQMIKEEKLQRLKASKERNLIPKKVNVQKTKRSIQRDSSDRYVDNTKKTESSSIPIKSQKSVPKQTQFKANEKVKDINPDHTKITVIRKLDQESTMSLDSLEELSNSKNDKTCQSIGINTELLCPCVPCVIHDNIELKVTTNKKSSTVERTETSEKINHTSADTKTAEPKIEILYKNPTMVSSCDIQSRKREEISSTEDLSIHNQPRQRTQNDSNQFTPTKSTCNFFESSNIDNYIDDDDDNKIKRNNTIPNVNDDTFAQSHSDEKLEDANESAEVFEEDNEHNVSTTFLDTTNNVKNEDKESTKESVTISRHGSGDTYTKFTENPDDLEEFMNVTDKMININSNEQMNDIEKVVDGLHTPKTNSLQSINENANDKNTDDNSTDKAVFTETFDELKSYFKALLKGTGNNIEEVKRRMKEDSESAETRKVSDMEHITVYEMNSNEVKKEESNEKISSNEEKEFKLPSISKHKKAVGRNLANKQRIQSLYKSNENFKMLSEQDRSRKEYKTYIKDGERDTSDERSEVPPLKLPRIDNKRIDDTYDPFASAARQMKQLMSSETNIPKKLQNCSNSTRTLPILRPSREKSLSSLRADNTKMMKDSLNKTYQYQTTPTLQRMKSFGSTTNDNSYTFGSRCSSFRNNKDDKKSSQQKLNTTFTKSSKENVSTTDKSYFNRSSNMNRSFSSYTTSKYSTPKPKEKIPKISTSMYHSFQRSTIKQPVKLDKITPKKEDNKNGFVNLDSILADSSMTSSMTDSNYIDPRLINENDNLPINVSSILNNSDMISSIESLLAKDNLPSKFDSFHFNNNNVQNNNATNHTIKLTSDTKIDGMETNNNIKNNTNNKLPAPLIDDLSAEYDKLMSSLEQSINSKTSIRDVDSICEDFDLEEFIISFDDELHKQHVENKRTCSSTTRVVKTELADSNKTSELNSNSSSPKVVSNDSNGLLPINKSMSFNVNSKNVVGDNLFPFSVKRSTSLLESIQKKGAPKSESAQSRQRADLLEEDIMQSLKDFDKFYEPEKVDSQPVNETHVYKAVQNGTAKRESRVKSEKKKPKADSVSNGNYISNGKSNGHHTPNGKSSDSAYSSLNRISPSKLSVCTKDSNGLSSLDQIPAGSDSSGCQKDEIRSISSEEFLAMERSAELGDALAQPTMTTSFKEFDNPIVNDKQGSSRASSRRSNQWPPALSSSSSEVSLSRPRRDSAPAPAPRLSRFCHECGSKYPVDTAKFCIECGIKRLMV